MKTRIYENEASSLFPVYPLTIGVNYPQEKTIRPSGLGFDQIFMVSKGNGTLIVDGKSYPLSSGDLFFVKRFIPHTYFGDENFETCFMGFCGSQCQGVLAPFNVGDYEVYYDKDAKMFYSSLKEFYFLFNSNLTFAELSSYTYNLLMVFFDEATKKAASPIEMVHSYLEENFNKPITLDDILAFYPFSKTTLCSEFKNFYGKSIFDALIKIRIGHARFMLINNPHMKIKDLIRYCGFNDESYFCKMYKREYKESPKGM